MHTDLHELLSPPTEDEKLRVPMAVSRIFANEDFQLVFRYMNMTAGDVFAPCFAPADKGDAILAAIKDGAKTHVRWLLDTYIASAAERKPRATEQDTTSTS